MEALQVVTATVSANNNINGVIYSTENNEESDEVEEDREDSDGTFTPGRTINLDDGNFVLSTAEFSPLINVIMTSQTAAPGAYKRCSIYVHLLFVCLFFV